jgi:nitrogenase-stabilizing/protective protein
MESSTMTDTLQALGALSAAEEFFELLAVPYEPAIVHVNRLHILKRFNQYLRTAAPRVADMDSSAQRLACQALLARAYEDFVRSTPAREKVFKVFQDADGSQVGLDGLRSTLPSRNLS